MEREEGEGVEGGVRSEGEEEGGQGHKEQNDGQGVEVPELQVGINNWICAKIKTSVVQRYSSRWGKTISGTTSTLRSGSAKTVMDSVGTVLIRTTLVEERASWRWERTGFLGKNADKDINNGGF